MIVMHYNPDRKPTIEVINDVKKRLQEIKTKYHLKSFSDVIEMILNERDKEKIKTATTIN